MTFRVITQLGLGIAIAVLLSAGISGAADLQTDADSPAEDAVVTDILTEGPQFSFAPGILTEWLNLKEHGLQFSGNWCYDETAILFGGRRPGYIRGQNLLGLGFLADLEHWFSVEGADLYLLFQSHRGINASSLTGDEQFIDNIDAAPYSARGQISELWYRQFLLDGKLRLKIGKIDANEDFAFVRNGALFMHSSFGNSPTIFLLPTYPDPATGADLLFTPNDKLYVGMGVFDGSLARGIATGRRGPATFFGAPSTYFLIGETGVNYQIQEKEGRIGVGYWRNTANFLVFTGTTSSVPDNTSDDFTAKPGTDGWYVVADQVFWRENPEDPEDEQGVVGFYQFGSADPRISVFENYHGAGVAWTGFWNGRDRDALGFGIAYAGLSSTPRAQNFKRIEAPVEPNSANEIAYQWFYQWQVSDQFSVQPNLTYVHTPGQDRGIPDVLAFTLRCVLAF